MNKSKFYIFIIIGLLLSNILLVGNLMFKKKHRKFHKDNPKNLIIKKLGFDENQIVDYEKLIVEHREFVIKADEQIISLKQELHKQLLESNNEKKVLELSNEIGKLHQQIEMIHYKHFSDIKNLCKAGQKEKFEEMIFDLEKIFAPLPNLPPPH